MTSSQFVILHHRLDDGEHWDLMLEHGEALLTWRLESPVNPGAFPIAARKTADHRKAYLTYEGPLSHNRGQVQRIDRGTLSILELSDHACRFDAGGSLLSGHFLLTRLQEEHWSLQPDCQAAKAAKTPSDC